MGGKKKKCGIVYPFAAETRGSDATSLHHPNSFKLCGVHTNPQKDAAANSRKKKHCHLYMRIADAN